MKLKILVFDSENSLRELLKTYLTNLGHEVHVFKDLPAARLCRAGDIDPLCAKEHPCADVVIVGIKLPNAAALDFFKQQRSRGCKAIDANRAIMSVGVTSDFEQAMDEFGCHHIRKPFRLADVKTWIDQCKARVAEDRGAAR